MLDELSLLLAMDHNGIFIWAAYGIVLLVLSTQFYLTYKQIKNF